MKYLLSCSVMLALTASATGARAEPPFTADKGQVGAQLGYGAHTGDSDVTPYGFGLGAHGGYTFAPGFHLGGRLEFHFGEKESITVLGVNAGSVSASSFSFMVEPGYDIGLTDGFVLRPQMGIGLVQFHAEGCGPVFGLGQVCSSDSEGDFTIAPGAMFLLDFGGLYGVAGLRFQHAFTDTDAYGDAFHFDVGAGVTF